MIVQNQEFDRACLLVGKEALLNPAWREYGEYCLHREKGLRKKAFAHLSAFLEDAKSWEFEEKKAFVQWLCDKMDSVPWADSGPYPNPLQNQLVFPFFQEWMRKEAHNAEVFALKARYTWDPEAYLKAIQIDPYNQRARVALAWESIDAISYSTHHLPEYFIGTEHEAINAVKTAEEHLSYFIDNERKKQMLAELRQEEQLLRDWIEFKTEEGNDFDQWCKDKGRRYNWMKAVYYSK
ncbi:hypothetical protein ACFL2Q_02590 [Thermodesulfobacteriota bacterium]